MKPEIITKAEREKRMLEEARARAKENMPSNWQMLKNLVEAAAEAVKGGLDVRPPEEAEAALKICAECPKLVFDDHGSRCSVCGCRLGGRGNGIAGSDFGKVFFRNWHCPLGKW